MSLSDLVARRAKARGHEYTLADFHGLALFVGAKGGKSSHFRYYWLGKQKRMSPGTYPAVSLREARALRDEARAIVVKGINPRAERKRKRQAARLAAQNTFDAVYRKWLRHRALSLEEGRQSTLGQIQRVFAKDVLPLLRGLTIFEVTRADLLDVIGRIKTRKSLSMAEKVRTWLAQLFDYATVIVPELEVNAALGLGVVAAPLPPVQHNPFLRLGELAPFPAEAAQVPRRASYATAARLLLLNGVRTGELRCATPDQFDLERGLWIIPPDKVKQLNLQMRRKRQRKQDMPPYSVPLSAQAAEIVRYMLEQFKAAQCYVFPGLKNLNTCISENTMNFALKRIGYDDRLTGPGIRATISTALHEIGYPEG